MNSINFSKNFPADIKASVIVFLVALPLCLGIAVTSQVPVFSGIVAGIVGGLVVGLISNSHTSVSGPAAGLTAIVAAAVAALGHLDALFAAVCLAGIMQLLAGLFKLGRIGDFVPISVIKGMLVAIGLILFFKQLEHAVGYDLDYEGNEDFMAAGNQNTIKGLLESVQYFEPTAVLISIVSVLLLIISELKAFKGKGLFAYVPPSLLVVFLGVAIDLLVKELNPNLALEGEHMVAIPENLSITFPALSALINPEVWKVALTLFLVASLESLLSIEAVDKLDPEKRITDANRELVAQGAGNMVSGLLGGLPVTAVIVRSSANIYAGAKSKMSAIYHGFWLLACVLLIPGVLNMIPKASLAAILLMTGYKLANPKHFRESFRQGWDQFIPFIFTIAAILYLNLLNGIIVGLAVGVIFMIKRNWRTNIIFTTDGKQVLIQLKHNVTFVNKGVLRSGLSQIPDGSSVLIDGRHALFIDLDIIETLDDFVETAVSKDIHVEIKKSVSSAVDYFRLERHDK